MSDFKKAIETVITAHEGGYQNRADDPGNFTPAGEQKGTKYGISAHSFPDEDIKNLTLDRAVYLYTLVWGIFSALNDQDVLTKVLDLAVNMQWAGHGPATLILQRAINVCLREEAEEEETAPMTEENLTQPDVAVFPVAEDGVFGPGTANSANALDPKKLLADIVTQAVARYKEIENNKPGMAGWFKSWDNRADWLPA